ncbi:hypothetical protein GH884_11370 [Bacillus thuringiensis]|nr:hypothetical protein [Bacillus thuringiensis]
MFSVIWTLTAVFVFRLYEERDEPLPFIFKLIGIIPTLPLYYGLYQYACKKDNDGLSHHCLFYFASYINHPSKC